MLIKTSLSRHKNSSKIFIFPVIGEYISAAATKLHSMRSLKTVISYAFFI